MRTALIALILCGCTAAANAQAPASGTAEKAGRTPAPAQTAAAPAPAETAAAPAATRTQVPAAPAAPSATASKTPENYTYDPSGRRDPFLSLIGGGVESRPTGRRAEGAPGLAVAEISVRGIMQSRGALIAMVQGPDNKTYVIHSGDKLVDGTVKTVTAQGLVIVQEVNDPLSLVKQREIRKLLRSFEDGKQ